MFFGGWYKPAAGEAYLLDIIPYNLCLEQLSGSRKFWSYSDLQNRPVLKELNACRSNRCRKGSVAHHYDHKFQSVYETLGLDT